MFFLLHVQTSKRITIPEFLSQLLITQKNTEFQRTCKYMSLVNKVVMKNCCFGIFIQVRNKLSHAIRKPDFEYEKTKAQISCAVTAQLIRYLFSLLSKFGASSHLLWLYNLVCVGPSRKPPQKNRFCGNAA